MGGSQVTDVFREGIGIVIRIAGPMLIVSMIVGVFVALLQAVTQIHEQSISFLLKVIVVVLFLVIGGGWMLELLRQFAFKMFELMV